MGCIFTQQVVAAPSSEVISFLKERNIQILSAAILDESKVYYELDYTKPTAVVVGTEATGLSQPWLDSCDESIIIPMEGKIDSLNVSVSAAILIFEAKRQRAALN
jgi:TrmH family RNA methyltransferase